jgi:nitrogen fixation protein FixH
MSPIVLPAARRQRGLQGRNVLWAFLGFFAVVFAANGAMIYAAVSTHTGLVANEPYRKGLHYNERIAADERQATLGWTGTVDIGRDGRVRVDLAGPDGRAVGGLVIAGVLGRPSTNSQDIALALSEISPGQYEARTSPLAEGSWVVSLEARAQKAADPVYRMRRRLWLER